jgi:hypothetical protein
LVCSLHMDAYINEFVWIYCSVSWKISFLLFVDVIRFCAVRFIITTVSRAPVFVPDWRWTLIGIELYQSGISTHVFEPKCIINLSVTLLTPLRLSFCCVRDISLYCSWNETTVYQTNSYVQNISDFPEECDDYCRVDISLSRSLTVLRLLSRVDVCLASLTWVLRCLIF